MSHVSPVTPREERLTLLFATMLEELNGKDLKEGCKAYARDRQVARARKRARYVKPELDREAVESFMDDNDFVGRREICCDPGILSNARSFIFKNLTRYHRSFSGEDNFQEVFDPAYLTDSWRFGPGASNGIRGTHTADKVGQEMTATALCEPFVAYIRQNNAYFDAYDSIAKSSGMIRVEGSRLTTVPKNEDTARTIAIEPSGNMACQLAAGHILEGVLRQVGLDIRRQQPLNKAMARRGSMLDDIATIDLKSASNLVGTDLVGALFPAEWYKLLMSIRSPVTSIDGLNVRLNMVSTMGNGFTFPLMTLIIVSLIYGYRAVHGGPNQYIDWSSTCVFGDDIIVPVHEYDGICTTLEQCGFLINHEKSYKCGPFRESCGGDYYEGVDVTPFYVKDLATDSDIYVAINQVLQWGAKTEIFLLRTLQYLVGLLRRGPFLVPEWHDPASGILCQSVSRRYKYLRAVSFRKRLKDERYLMMLACGGYVSSSGLDVVYTPRLNKTRYVVKAARLPRGYLDGADPLTRSARCTSLIGLQVSLLFDYPEG